ncbi:carbohydrate deacetylase [Virgibacillus phasianinus]|uniref:Carbohydrate deacetylase n=1 Tax=Virgibacillus phasianinus TaxID=2017483 RepID=A0A220U7N9_9BACI|nr:ChbG/HpnK family deacetylase [Virgibacillus phasianinus]ASK63871.1 carbohydrate deacetylase [Virgibacillus phasianinus]
MKKFSSKIIVNADDFGLSPGVTAGILYAHHHDILTSTTAMVNTEFSRESLEDVKRYPRLGVGLHFVLDAGQPISSSVRSLTNHTGNFLKGKTLIEHAKKVDIKEELKAQLDLLYMRDIDVTHIDSHHHMHLHIPCAMEAVIEIAQIYDLPVRSFTETRLPGELISTDFLHYDFYGNESVTPEYLMNILSELQPGITEIMCHPAFMDPWLTKKSSYNYTRTKELEILVNNKIKNWIKKHSIDLIHYGGIANEH